MLNLEQTLLRLTLPAVCFHPRCMGCLSSTVISGMRWSLKGAAPSHRQVSFLVCELAKRGVITTFSQSFFLESSTKHECVPEAETPPCLHLQNRGRGAACGQCSLTPGHLASIILQSFEHSLPQSRANGS